MFNTSRLVFRTPKKRLYVWIVSLAVFLSTPVFTVLYYFEMYDKGGYSENGDAITVPIFHNFVGLAVLFPFFCGFLYFATRNYVGEKPLTFWNRDRPYWSICWSMFFLVLIIINLIAIPHIWDWGLLSEAVKLLINCWFFLYLRAVILAKRRHVTTDPDAIINRSHGS